jgi:hypothetical protein
MTRVAIGLVGYFQFIRAYPLGPEFRERIDARMDSTDWQGINVSIKEMNWGPIAIVQEFQAHATQFERMVLVATVDRGLAPGSITCRQWLGGELDHHVVQGRIFEAVTGVISLDNLLVIGEHFNIWPPELITIEVQLADTGFGDLVLSELASNRQAGESRVIGNCPLQPEDEKIVEEMVSITQKAVTKGVGGLSDLYPLTAEQLTPLNGICHHQLSNGRVATRY